MKTQPNRSTRPNTNKNTSSLSSNKNISSSSSKWTGGTVPWTPLSMAVITPIKHECFIVDRKTIVIHDPTRQWNETISRRLQLGKIKQWHTDTGTYSIQFKKPKVCVHTLPPPTLPIYYIYLCCVCVCVRLIWYHTHYSSVM